MLNCIVNFFGNHQNAKFFSAHSNIQILDNQNTIANPRQATKPLLKRIDFSAAKDIVCIYPEEIQKTQRCTGNVCDAVLVYVDSYNQLKIAFLELKTTYPRHNYQDYNKAKKQLQSTSECFNKISVALTEKCNCKIANKKTYCIIRKNAPEGFEEPTEVRQGSIEDPFVITTTDDEIQLNEKEVSIIIN